MVQEPSRPFPKAGARLVYELARDRIGMQLNQMDALDTKLASFLGLGSALLGIGAAVLALREDTPPAVTIVLFALASVLYVILAVICLRGYRLRDWKAGPKLEDAWANARQYTEQSLYWWAAEAYTNFYLTNRVCLQPKIEAGKTGIWLLTFETGALALGLLIAALD